MKDATGVASIITGVYASRPTAFSCASDCAVKKLRSTQNTCHTLRLPPARVSHRCSDTFPTRSRRWPSVSVASSPGNYRSVRAAERTCSDVNIINTVELGAQDLLPQWTRKQLLSVDGFRQL